MDHRLERIEELWKLLDRATTKVARCEGELYDAQYKEEELQDELDLLYRELDGEYQAR